MRCLLWRILDDFKAWLWEYVVEPELDDDDLRFFFTLFDSGSTILQGIIEDRLIERGFDAVNGEDLRAWMRRHGARPITLDQGPFVRGLYDMAFAYERGDIHRPAMAAGTALHDLLRLFFTYRGAFAWKMQAGMGDTVFAPFYEVLRNRGVHFNFFHWVSELRLSADGRYVQEIDVIPQARLRAGLQEYEPLVEVGGLPCWPSEPRWEQLEPFEGLDKFNFEREANPEDNDVVTLHREEEFDIAVLGISVGALPAICGELINDRSNPDFARMIENSHTVMTQAFQLWLNRPLRGLGWPFSGNSAACSFVEPLDTYANMSHLLPREQWPAQENVKDVAYFCGVLEDVPGETQARADARVRAGAIAFLKESVRWIWPQSTRATGFDFSQLVDPAQNRGQARFDSQFWLANLQPSERYVLTLPGTVGYRLKAEQSGYENLFLAGDWIKTGLDAGCVEAAAMSGMQASRAICGAPAAIVGEDDKWLAGPGRGTSPPKGPPLPKYVDYGGLATCPSPVNCTGATVYSFFLRADYASLAELCGEVFAERTRGGVDVRPLLPCVMLTFGRVRRIEPLLDPWSRMGYAKESQVALWIPVALMADQAPLEIGWFVPSMWVDNPLSLAGGREIYGYNKMWGSISMPESGPPSRLTLEAYGGDYDPSQPAGLRTLIEVEVAGADRALAAEEPRWTNLAEVVADARHSLERSQGEWREEAGSRTRGAAAAGAPGPPSGPQPLPEHLFDAIVAQGGPPQFFLRQFRAVEDGQRSCNQQVTKAGTTVKRIVGRPIRGQCTFTLHRLDSHPIGEELGLSPQQRALAAFATDMDFVLEDGSPLWEA